MMTKRVLLGQYRFCSRTVFIKKSVFKDVNEERSLHLIFLAWYFLPSLSALVTWKLNGFLSFTSLQSLSVKLKLLWRKWSSYRSVEMKRKPAKKRWLHVLKEKREKACSCVLQVGKTCKYIYLDFSKWLEEILGTSKGEKKSVIRCLKNIISSLKGSRLGVPPGTLLKAK